MTDTTMTYPEHAKLERLGGERTMLTEFAAWLSDQGVYLVRYGHGAKNVTDVSALVAKFLGIDESRLEVERTAMLDALREFAAERCA